VKRIQILCFVILCVALVSPLAVASVQSPEVTITSPEEGVTIATRVVTVEATFAASDDTPIDIVEFLVDDAVVAARNFDVPVTSGSVRFAWTAKAYSAGTHAIAVRATDSRGLAGTAEISVYLDQDQCSLPRAPRITAPAEGAVVSGHTPIQIDVDRSAPVQYVIFLVDDVFKAMSNVPPFAYTWDTTRYLNGMHTLKIKVYCPGEWEVASPQIRVQVNNPSGATTMRPSRVTAAPVAPAPLAAPVRAGEPNLPPPMRTESPDPQPQPMLLSKPEIVRPGSAPFISSAGDLITPPEPHAALDQSSGEASEVVASPSRNTLAETVGLLPTGQTPTTAPLEIALLQTEPALTPKVEPSRASSPGPAAALADSAVLAENQGPTSAPLEVAMLPPRPAEPRPAPRVAAEPASAQVTYVVQPGDWLTKIASEFGCSPAEIARANGLDDPRDLRPGQALRIPTVSVYYGGHALVSDAPTVIADGRALVPFRAVVEEAGGQVRWESAERRACAVARGHTIDVTVASDIAVVDGSETKMTSPAALRCDRTIVPLRFLSDAIDLVLQYEDGVIHIAERP